MPGWRLTICLPRPCARCCSDLPLRQRTRSFHARALKLAFPERPLNCVARETRGTDYQGKRNPRDHQGVTAAILEQSSEERDHNESRARIGRINGSQ